MDVVSGSTSTETAMLFSQEDKQLFENASMNLREWSSNSVEFLQQVLEQGRASATIVKVLRMAWNVETDTLGVVQMNPTDQVVQTKRNLVSRFSIF